MTTKKKDNFAKFLMRSTDTIKELICIYLVIITACSLLFMWFESMKFGDAMWMSFVTATTTGYGDFFPKTLPGRIVGVFLMHMVAFVVAPLLVYRFIDAIDNNDFTHNEQEDQKHKMEWIIRQLEGQTGSKYAPRQLEEEAEVANV